MVGDGGQSRLLHEGRHGQVDRLRTGPVPWAMAVMASTTTVLTEPWSPRSSDMGFLVVEGVVEGAVAGVYLPILRLLAPIVDHSRQPFFCILHAGRFHKANIHPYAEFI